MASVICAVTPALQIHLLRSTGKAATDVLILVEGNR